MEKLPIAEVEHTRLALMDRLSSEGYPPISINEPGSFDEAAPQEGITFLGKPTDSNALLPLAATALEMQ